MGRPANEELEPWEDLALGGALQGLSIARIAQLVQRDESSVRAAMKKDVWKVEWRKRMDPLKALIVAGLQEEMARRVCDKTVCQALKPDDLVKMYKCLAGVEPAGGAGGTTANLRFVFNLPPGEMQVIQDNPMLAELAELAVQTDEKEKNG